MYRIHSSRTGTTVVRAETLEDLLKKAVNLQRVNVEADLQLQKKLGGEWRELEQGVQIFRPQPA